MRCHEFEDRMNDVLDQRLAPERDGLLVRHAGECPSCRRLLEGQAALFSGLDLWETPALSHQFAAAVLVGSGQIPLGTTADVAHRPKANWLRVIAGLAALAAVVLVAVWIGLSKQQDAARPVAAKPAQPVLPKTVDASKAPAPQPAAAAGDMDQLAGVVQGSDVTS